jgi:hypothetical protein
MLVFTGFRQPHLFELREEMKRSLSTGLSILLSGFATTQTQNMRNTFALCFPHPSGDDSAPIHQFSQS